MPDGESVETYLLTNANGCEIEILSLGGIIRRWIAPTSEGQDIVLGLDTVEAYLNDPCYFGAVIGRYANRIGQGQFSICDKTYSVDVNQAGHCLHGGSQGFNKRNWIVESVTANSLILSLKSADGDQGFPGNLLVKTHYSLDERNCLRIEYSATCDEDTVYNPTQHSYFNLNGHDSGSATAHFIQVYAEHFTPGDATALPTGEIRPVAQTPLDLNQLCKISDVLSSDYEQIQLANGIDHNFCVNGYSPDTTDVRDVGRILSEEACLELSVRSSMPGAQVYTGNFIGNDLGKDNCRYGPNHGLCIETQHYPDAPNKKHFPSPLLKAGEVFSSVTEYQLNVI